MNFDDNSKPAPEAVVVPSAFPGPSPTAGVPQGPLPKQKQGYDICDALKFRPVPAHVLARMDPKTRAAYEQERAHHERWGHLPPRHHQHLRSVMELPAGAVENHARTRGTHMVHFAAAAARFQWAIGQEMPIEDFDAAIQHVLSIRFGY